MALKAQKELELKVHEEFYKNVFSLTMCFPPSPEFREVFKKDMFIKNNKAGFHHVVYYLLGLLNFERLKQKVPTWPPLDLRLENQFRNEVMKYVNELNIFYPDARIPQIVTSHLISPGGFKFVKFMFKLSQLVLFEQLQRNTEVGPNMLLPILPSKDEAMTSERIEKLQLITNIINQEIGQTRHKFDQCFEAMKVEAQEIVVKQQENNKRFKENQVKLQSLHKQLETEFPGFKKEGGMGPDLENKLRTLREIEENFNRCEELNSFLSSSNAKLVHNTQLKIPDQISYVVRVENDELDLVSLIEGCNTLIDRKRLEIRPMSDQELSKQIQRFDSLNNQLLSMNEEMEHIQTQLVNLSEKLQEQTMENTSSNTHKIKTLQENDSDSSSSTALAVPLPLSPSTSGNESLFSGNLF